jgi:hypothetical protein
MKKAIPENGKVFLFDFQCAIALILEDQKN